MRFTTEFQQHLDEMDWGIIKLGFFVALLMAGSFSTGGWVRGIEDHDATLVQTQKAAAALPAVAAEAHCEHWRADKSAAIAKMAIKGANSDSAPIPDAKSLPRDSCDKGPETAQK